MVETRLPWERLRDDEESKVAAGEMEHIISNLSQDDSTCVKWVLPSPAQELIHQGSAVGISTQIS